ncbi:hypothetical protein Tsp_03023 [Trichinella spiralis]|uniref:hypothetical protein n=1 Tax=Trichinella spiralis TaxID=6334 RepID=UPI0001EFB3F9|nr:hypothetical protein Tsp_03023 [Trichinella spiralis]
MTSFLGQLLCKKRKYSPPKMQNENLEWRIVVHPIAELLSYADDLAKKRRNCGSCFLVPDTPCIWCANWWKCSLFEHRKCIWCLLYFYTERNGILCITIMFSFIYMFIDSIDYALQGETMGMHKVRTVSLSPKAVSEQDGIVEVPEETDFSGITSLNKTVPFKILSLERGNLLGNGNCILSI